MRQTGLFSSVVASTGNDPRVPASPLILEKCCYSPLFYYAWGVSSVQEFVNSQLARGRGFFTKSTALAELGLSPEALKSAIVRLSRKGALISPRQGFYLILRPEDRALGAPDPARWIDPLMKFLQVDYRISLLRAAAFHGASHQAAMEERNADWRLLINVAVETDQ